MRRVVHLFDRGSRFPHGISQGLLEHPDVTPAFCAPVVSHGEVVAPAATDLRGSLVDADLILRCDDAHFGRPDIDAVLDRERLWDRVVYYDFKDSAEIDHHRLDTCAAYVKRSYLLGPDRRPLPATVRPVHPIDYAVLDEYVLPRGERDLDVACCFDDDPAIGERRYRVLQSVQRLSAVGALGVTVTGTSAVGGVARQAIFAPRDTNPMLEYLEALTRSRAVVTAFPDAWDGDSRTWEAFASGALVCMDATHIPSRHPIEHGAHALLYDARDQRSIDRMLEHLRYLLGAEDERVTIADRGAAHVYAHHRWVNRVGEILDIVDGAGHPTSVADLRHLVTPALTPTTFPAPVAGRPLPDFLGIGAQKAGTTWLARRLADVPGIHLPEQKELHWFDRDHVRGAHWYHDGFEAPAGTVLRGEITPAYAVLPAESVAAVRDVVGECRIVFSMRNPIERAWSAARMELGRAAHRRGRTLDEVPTGEIVAFLTSAEVDAKSCYADTIVRWRAVFGADALHLVWFDDIVERPDVVVKDLLSFLAIEGAAPASALDEVVFAGADRPMPPDVRELLVRLYAPEVERLADLVGMDLSHWQRPDSAGTVPG